MPVVSNATQPKQAHTKETHSSHTRQTNGATAQLQLQRRYDRLEEKHRQLQRRSLQQDEELGLLASREEELLREVAALHGALRLRADEWAEETGSDLSAGILFELARLRDEVRAGEAERTELQKLLEAVAQHVGSLSAENGTLHQQADHVALEADRHRAVVETLQAELAQAVSCKTEMLRHMEDTARQCDALRLENATLERRLHEAVAAATEIERDRAEQTGKLHQQHQQVKQLALLREVHESHIAREKQRCSMLVTANAELEAAVTELGQRLQAAEDSAQRSHQGLADATEQLTALQCEYERLLMRFSEAEKEAQQQQLESNPLQHTFEETYISCDTAVRNQPWPDAPDESEMQQLQHEVMGLRAERVRWLEEGRALRAARDTAAAAAAVAGLYLSQGRPAVLMEDAGVQVDLAVERELILPQLATRISFFPGRRNAESQTEPYSTGSRSRSGSGHRPAPIVPPFLPFQHPRAPPRSPDLLTSSEANFSLTATPTAAGINQTHAELLPGASASRPACDDVLSASSILLATPVPPLLQEATALTTSEVPLQSAVPLTTHAEIPSAAFARDNETDSPTFLSLLPQLSTPPGAPVQRHDSLHRRLLERLRRLQSISATLGQAVQNRTRSGSSACTLRKQRERLARRRHWVQTRLIETERRYAERAGQLLAVVTKLHEQNAALVTKVSELEAHAAVVALLASSSATASPSFVPVTPTPPRLAPAFPLA